MSYEDKIELYTKELTELFDSQHEFHFLLKEVLSLFKKFTNSDAGTIYILTKDKHSLEFIAVQNDTLFLDLSKHEDNLPWPSLQLYSEEGVQNEINISVKSVLEEKTINIPNISQFEDFELEGPKAFDMYSGYNTVSMLNVPINNEQDEVLGVIQLINKKNDTNEIISYNQQDEEMILTFAKLLAKAV